MFIKKHTHIYTYVYKDIPIYVFKDYIYTFVYVNVYVHIYIEHIYIHVYICIYIWYQYIFSKNTHTF